MAANVTEAMGATGICLSALRAWGGTYSEPVCTWGDAIAWWQWRERPRLRVIEGYHGRGGLLELWGSDWRRWCVSKRWDGALARQSSRRVHSRASELRYEREWVCEVSERRYFGRHGDGQPDVSMDRLWVVAVAC